MSDISLKLKQAGVKNLKHFGYPHVDTTNIMSDRIYSAFFVSMLKETRDANVHYPIKNACVELLEEISSHGDA